MTFMVAETKPAAIAPPRPRSWRTRRPEASAATLSSVTQPAAIESVLVFVRCTTLTTNGVITIAGTEHMLTSRTPTAGPSTNTITGAHTREKPRPATACANAPAATARVATMSASAARSMLTTSCGASSRSASEEPAEPVDRTSEAFADVDFRLPPELAARQRDIGPPLFRIILRKGTMLELRP